MNKKRFYLFTCENKTAKQLNDEVVKVKKELEAIMNAHFRPSPRLNREITTVYFVNNLLITYLNN